MNRTELYRIRYDALHGTEQLVVIAETASKAKYLAFKTLRGTVYEKYISFRDFLKYYLIDVKRGEQI